MRIGILNGPNLNWLGKREPEIYGDVTFESQLETWKEKFSDHDLIFFQSNHEGELLDKLQEWDNICDGILVNAGALSHTSIALADCIKMISTEVLEIHISNTHKREEFRRHSYLSAVVRGTILGLGLDSYRLGIHYFLSN